MSASQAYSVPIIDGILHPSDFSAASEVAFAHAPKAALVAQSELTIMHVSPSMTADRRAWERPSGALSHSAGLAMERHREVG